MLALESVVVVIDTQRTVGQKLLPITDYATFIGLAGLRPERDYRSVPTILNLFGAAGDAAPVGLTDWDAALLAALYDTEQKYVLQRSQVAQRMLQDVAPLAATETERR